jgi:hypothetical protein
MAPRAAGSWSSSSGSPTVGLARPAERSITLAIAEADEDLAVARLAFLAHGDLAALDAAMEACLARRRRSLRTRWRAISLLARVRYPDQ